MARSLTAHRRDAALRAHHAAELWHGYKLIDGVPIRDTENDSHTLPPRKRFAKDTGTGSLATPMHALRRGARAAAAMLRDAAAIQHEGHSRAPYSAEVGERARVAALHAELDLLECTLDLAACEALATRTTSPELDARLEKLDVFASNMTLTAEPPDHEHEPTPPVAALPVLPALRSLALAPGAPSWALAA